MEKQQEPRETSPPASSQTSQEQTQPTSRRYGLFLMGFFGIALLGALVVFSPGASLQEPDLSALSSQAEGASMERSGAESLGPSAPFEGTATLSITSSPSEANVFIDGDLIGTTPIETHTVPAGVYHLMLQKAGYLTRDTISIIQADTASDLAFTLQAHSETYESVPLAATSPPDYERERHQTMPDPAPPMSRPEPTDELLPSADEPSASSRDLTEHANGASENEATTEHAATTGDSFLADLLLEERYDSHLARGNELLIQEQYLLARREYELALEVRPDDERAAARIARIDTLLAQTRRDEQHYNYHRGRGDAFFEQKDFETAARSYESALEYRPEDAYLQKRMAAIETLQRESETKGGVVFAVDEEAKLIGGLAGLHRQVRYPQVAERRGIEGRVVVQVTIDEEGHVQDAHVLKGIGGGCDEEALRVIKRARFEPAKVGGRPVMTQQALWIQFELSGAR